MSADAPSGRRSSAVRRPVPPAVPGGDKGPSPARRLEGVPAGADSKAERRTRRRRRRRMLYAVAALAVGAGAAVSGWAYWHFVLAPPATGTVSSGGPGGNNSSGLPPPPVLILPENSQFSLAPGTHHDTAFQLNRTCLLSGDFSASGDVNVLVMTDSQYHTWTGGGSIASQWSSGVEKSGAVQATIGAGSYELVFLNPSTTSPTFVNVPAGVSASAI